MTCPPYDMLPTADCSSIVYVNGETFIDANQMTKRNVIVSTYMWT